MTDPTDPTEATEAAVVAEPMESMEPVEAPTAGEEKARKPRRAAVLRWSAAVAVLLLSGAAVGWAVTLPERTKIPGLETPNDGRYAFPELTLPPLPSGKPRPVDADSYGRHYADLRQLLLSAPKGATVVTAPATSTAPAAATGAPSASASASAAPSTAAPVGPVGADWVRCTDYAAADTHTDTFKALLAENACRAATKRVWTASDGTRTEIWLLHFGSRAEASAFYGGAKNGDLRAVPGLTAAAAPMDPSVDGKSTVAFTPGAAGGKGEPTGRVAYLLDGDIEAEIVMTNPKGVPMQAFRQVLILQDELLA